MVPLGENRCQARQLPRQRPGVHGAGRSGRLAVRAVNEMPDVKGQSAIVTGAGSGLGEATAVRLAELGARVALLARSRAAAAGTDPAPTPGTRLLAPTARARGLILVTGNAAEFA